MHRTPRPRPAAARAAARTVAALMLIGGLSACSALGGDSSTDAPTSIAEAKADAEAESSAWLDDLTAEDVDAVLTAFQERVGGESAQITQLDASNGVITLYATDPAAPEELNAWSWHDGEVGEESTPVDYGGDTEALEQNVFGIDEVSGAGIVAAIDAAPGAAEVDGGAATGLTISRDTPFSLDLKIDVSVTADRGSATVRTDLDGAVVKVF
ncbi:hypothetical protein [Brachybacterium hainanense]|uniref:Lipoprotein n=1 Tax=Brachybacterium hainanense TaxID=1541174 RepID=A0ABV6RG35_9MICO